MFLQTIILVSGLLSSLTLGAPMPDPAADTTPANPLVRRGGDHRALIYTNYHCSGVSLVEEFNFGCGGRCINFQTGRSVSLTQQDAGGAMPTASLFYAANCQGSYDSAGIWAGQVGGCTDASQEWHSAYLYFDC